jgi:RNA polymerase sigma-70 factor (ECF subfamily)
MVENSPATEALLARAAAGDGAAWGALLTSHEQRLTRMVCFRMDARLQGRVDAADVVQEAFAEAAEHRADYFRAAAAAAPLFLWLRGVVCNKLLEVHRHHLGTRMRDARRERPLESRPGATPCPQDTSAALCDHLTAGLTRPSVAAARAEMRSRLSRALESMDPTDREVLALRHFEQLSNDEASKVLGIQERAAAKRYLRALGRLREILSEMPGGLTELRP